MAKNAFGLEGDPETPEEDPFSDSPEVADTEPEVVAADESSTADPLAPAEAEEAPEEVEMALDEAEKPAEAESEAEIEAEEPETAPEVEGTPYTGRYATKYKTVEAMEEAHRNALDMAQRNAEARNLKEQENQQLVAYLQAAAAKFDEIEKAQAAAKAKTPDIELDPDVEALLQSRIEPTTRELETLKAELAQQQQQQYAAEQIRLTKENTAAYRAAHAEELDEDTEFGMVEVFREFQFDPTDPNAYPVAHEAATNPALRDVLRADQGLLDSAEGLALARRLAGIHPVTTPAPTADLAAARKRATVEGGGSGTAPVTEEVQKDAWDLVLDEARGARTKSAFGV